MAQIEVTAWEIDPAFALIGPDGLQTPENWEQHHLPGGSPYGTDGYQFTGPPVDVSGYVRSVTITDIDDDGMIRGNDTDSFTMNGIEYSIYSIYRGDMMTVNGESYQTITLYGQRADEGPPAAVTLPVNAEGQIVAAYPGMLHSTLWSMDSEPYPIPLDELPCFTLGTRIATPEGAVAVEDIRVGDLVMTEKGPTPVIWVTGRCVALLRGQRSMRAAPIVVPKGSFGATRDLWLSPRHRLLVTDLNGEEVLVPVCHLRGLAAIGSKPFSEDTVVYIHLALAEHGIISADGVACETFYPGRRAVELVSAADRARLYEVWPEAAGPETVAPARPLLDLRGQVRNRLGHVPAAQPKAEAVLA